MIVIAGAGIAGLAAAIALAPHGEVLVVERRSADAANAGAGIQLAPNAIKALAAIGADRAVIDVARRPPGLTIRAAGRARPVTRLGYGVLPGRYGAASYTLSRAALHRALLAEASAREGVSVRYDTALGAAEDAPDGVHLPELGLTARLLVAADGVGSALRQAVAGDAPAPTGWVAWRGRGEAAGADTELVMAAGMHLVRYGIGDSANIVFVAPERGGGPEAARGPLAGELAAVADLVPWPIRVRARHDYGRGRIAMIGDAAHAMLPFLAQGAAMALEDAAVLGAAVARHGVAPAAVAAYGAARAPRTRRLAADTVRQGQIYHMPPPLSLARDIAMRQLGEAAILARLDRIYGWTPERF